jgi:hypothetical protein
MHLFRDTYIALDAHIDLNNDRIVISKDNGFPLIESLYSVTTGNLISYGISLNAVLARAECSSLLGLFEKCLDNNIDNPGIKVVIYCDNDSYYEITAIWHKILFANINAEASYNILETNLAALGIIGAKDHSPNSFRYSTAIPLKSNYNTIFNNVSVDAEASVEFLEKISNSKSIEYMIANYLYNGSYVEQIKTPLKMFVSKIVKGWFNDIWRNTTSSGSLRTTTRNALGLTSGGIDNVLAFSDDPIYNNGFKKICQQLSLDLNILSSEEQIAALETANLLTYIFIIGIEKTISKEILAPEHRESIPKFERLNTYYNILINSPDLLSDTDVANIIDLELYSFFASYNLGSLPSKYTVNTYMLEYFYEAVRNNQKDLLIPYLLR